jgi:hypothetical protein
MIDLDKLIEQVNDRESFLLFVKALIEDRELEVAEEKKNPSQPYGPGSMGWENGSIEDYLESSVAWTEAWVGKKHELPQEASWSSFARFLYAGKYYE